jgi:hypothetical protein
MKPPDNNQQEQLNLDLNMPASKQDINKDLHPVILNPVMPAMPGENGDFLELNDLENNMHEHHLFQP